MILLSKCDKNYYIVIIWKSQGFYEYFLEKNGKNVINNSELQPKSQKKLAKLNKVLYNKSIKFKGCERNDKI